MAIGRRIRDGVRRARRQGGRREIDTPHLALVRAPSHADPPRSLRGEILVATYNVHRWTGLNGRTRPDPRRASAVIAELDVDLIALQEVLRPQDDQDPLESLAEQLGMHVAFAVTRIHRRGPIGNAVLSRWPLEMVSMLDLTLSRFEKRVAVAVRISDGSREMDVISTHLALTDRTRRRQVEWLLGHPDLQGRPTLLLGDLNAWRRSRTTNALEWELGSHNNRQWPASFPALRPMLALDRIYTRDLQIEELHAFKTAATRRASDHLPVVARIRFTGAEGPPRPAPIRPRSRSRT